MIIKALRNDGSYLMFDNVTNLVYSSEHEYLPSPLIEDCKSEISLEAFVESVLSSEDRFKKWCPENRNPIFRHMGGMAEDMPTKNRTLFIGNIDTKYNKDFWEENCVPLEDEKGNLYISGDKPALRFKCVSFEQNDVQYTIYTDSRVYVCSDTGKTVDIVNK